MIEAVFEEMSVKQQVFAEVEAVVSAECVLATNTSSLSITEMAADLEHPERVVGFHFFNPVAVMPLLEIIPGEATDDAALATAFATGRTLGKTTIRVKDTASFVVNRLLGRFMGEFSRIVDEGTPVATADRAVLDPLAAPVDDTYIWAKPDAQRESGYQQRDLPSIEGGIRQMDRRYVAEMDRQLQRYWLMEYIALPADQRIAAIGPRRDDLDRSLTAQAEGSLQAQRHLGLRGGRLRTADRRPHW